MRVLIAENIGESGVDLLRAAGFDVVVGTDWGHSELGAESW
jgi:predicted Fe-Mo cluster-binding NifX family protein